MHAGLGSYAFAWAIGVPGYPPLRPVTASELLEKASRLGLRLVQFCDNLPLTQLKPAELEELSARAADLNIQVELGTVGLSPENLRAYLGLAQQFHSPFVRLVVDSPGDEPTPGEIVERLRPTVAEFAAAGISLAIENHDRLRSATLAGIVERLGTEHVGICLDTVNSFGALEGPEVVVKTLAPYTRCVHAKDFVIRRVSHRMGFVLEGCPTGEGQLDVPSLLTHVTTASPHPFNIILETWVPLGETLAETINREQAWAERSSQYLRTMIPD